MTYLQTFSDSTSVEVTHNLGSVQVLVRLIVDGEARSDLVSSIVVADANSLTVNLSETLSGSILVQVPRDWRVGG
jgi:hypothetical protein